MTKYSVSGQVRVPAGIAKAAHDFANRLRAEGYDDAHINAGLKEFVESAELERKRILAIQALPAKGVGSVVAECVNDPECTVEMAARRILEASQLRRAMASVPARR